MRLLVFAIPGLALLSLGCSDERIVVADPPKAGARITREMLLANGFKDTKNDTATFEARHVRLASIASALGFDRAELHPTVNQAPGSDIRAGEFKGVWVVVESEVNDVNDGHAALDQRDPLCTVSVVLNPYPVPTYKETESTPSLRITSAAAASEGNRKILRITFELRAVGKTPIAISQSQLAIRLDAVDGPRRLIGKDLTFASGTPEILTVSPEKPLVVTVTKSGSYLDRSNQPSELSNGRYDLRVSIDPLSKIHRFDYHWVGYTDSRSREIVIK